MENNSIKIFLTSFFALFGAYVKEFRIEGVKVLGAVGWKGEEDEQIFSWVIDYGEAVLQKMKLLCELLTQHNLTEGDKILIQPSELKILLQNKGWNKKEAEEVVDNLCSVNIKMIDDGEETDSFFIHF